MIFCTKCGFNNTTDATFCINCGENLNIFQEKNWNRRMEKLEKKFRRNVEHGYFGLSRIDTIVGLFIGIFIIFAYISILVGGGIGHWILSLLILLIGLMILAASLSRIWHK